MEMLRHLIILPQNRLKSKKLIWLFREMEIQTLEMAAKAEMKMKVNHMTNNLMLQTTGGAEMQFWSHGLNKEPLQQHIRNKF